MCTHQLRDRDIPKFLPGVLTATRRHPEAALGCTEVTHKYRHALTHMRTHTLHSPLLYLVLCVRQSHHMGDKMTYMKSIAQIVQKDGGGARGAMGVFGRGLAGRAAASGMQVIRLLARYMFVYAAATCQTIQAACANRVDVYDCGRFGTGSKHQSRLFSETSG